MWFVKVVWNISVKANWISFGGCDLLKWYEVHVLKVWKNHLKSAQVVDKGGNL